MKRFLVALITLVFISTNLYSAGIIKKYDSFKKITTYQSEAFDIEDGSYYLIAATGLNIDNAVYSLSVITVYYADSWRFYNSAYDSKGNKLKLIETGRDVDCSLNGCQYSEVLCFIFTKREFKAMKNGVTIKIYGRAGNNIIINIPGNDVKELIAAVNK